MSPPTPTKTNETAMSIGERSAAKVLREFGSASVRKPVSEGRVMAERMGK